MKLYYLCPNTME